MPNTLGDGENYGFSWAFKDKSKITFCEPWYIEANMMDTSSVKYFSVWFKSVDVMEEEPFTINVLLTAIFLGR